jgi:hypothetical protein
MKKLLLLLALAMFLENPAFADAVSPCQPGTLTTIANVTCSIGDKIFAFGSPEFSTTASVINFVPDAATTGFVLSGDVHIENISPFGPAVETFSIPFAVSTVNGQAQIVGITSSVSGSTTGAGVLAPTFILCSTTVCTFPRKSGGAHSPGAGIRSNGLSRRFHAGSRSPVWNGNLHFRLVRAQPSSRTLHAPSTRHGTPGRSRYGAQEVGSLKNLRPSCHRRPDGGAAFS